MGVKAVLKRMLHNYREVRNWYHRVWKSHSDYPIHFFEKIKYAQRGFNAGEYYWFDLKHNDYREYISDYIRIKSREINGDYKIILDDKLLFEEIFRKYVRVPTVYAYISDSKIYDIHGYNISENTLISFLKKQKKAVLKWKRGYEGKGTFVITTLANKLFDVNGSVVSSAEVVKLCVNSSDAILCEYMKQSEFAQDLYPHSANTMRIVCAKKKGEKRAKVVKAAQRIGNEYSKPADNVSQGAIACEIDLKSGELGRCVIPKDHNLISVTRNKSRISSVKFFENHPDTGVQITGKTIPAWRKLVTDIENLTNCFPYLNFVAWDVLLTDKEDGYCIIEANASAGCVMFQMEHGIKNEEIGNIYRSYGIIK